MTENRFDQQKAITRASIQEAFIKLLDEKPFDEITVREIAKHAQIGFKTFYRHYNDKIDLAHAMTAEMWKKTSKVIELPESLEATEANIHLLLKIVMDNVSVIKALGRTPIRNEIFQPILEFGFEEALRLQDVVLDGQTKQDQNLQDIVASHFIHAHFHLILWWADHDLALPVDTMVNLISHLILQPIWNLPELNQSNKQNNN
jgi:AcrR family transcriptional regulator